jgi:hypothetical protein
MQKAIVITVTDRNQYDMDTLNRHLEEGWRVVSQRPMGGVAPGSTGLNNAFAASLVIIEKGEV